MYCVLNTMTIFEVKENLLKSIFEAQPRLLPSEILSYVILYDRRTQSLNFHKV